MPNIYCLTRNCAYNNDCNCCLDHVKVGGKNAQTPQSTCCDSFIQSHSTMKLGSTPCSCTDIDCDAEKCRHNCGGHCAADSISVCNCAEDGSDACTCSQTECASFSKNRKAKP